MLVTRASRALIALLVAGLLGCLTAPLAVAAPHRHAVPLTDTRPNTTNCPQKQAPPKAVDTSEKPKPGATAPQPLPVPATPAGGPRMAECGYVLPEGAGPLPKHLDFGSWVLFDLDSGNVLAAKDPHGRQRPASILKSLFALVVLRDLKMNKVVTGTQADADAEGTRVGIVPKGRYTVEQLLTALLLKSGNDLAHALATQLGGMDKAVDKMNELAAQLCCKDTRAATPSGLDGPGMSTSAYDMANIFRTAMANPTFAKIVHTQKMSFPDGHGKSYEVANDNKLLGKYPGDLGGKTGFTDDAQHTFLNAADRDGHRVGLVMMHGMNHLEGMYQNATGLMDYGFALSGANVAPVGHLDRPAPTAQEQHNQGSPAMANSANDSWSPTWLIVVAVLVVIVLALLLVLWLYRRSRRKPTADAD
ncbi:D-alanyl-D-alanine carboxypeptidase family protein [Sciscionella marina]|uniref:D-alanyl-D-alanine carboxypeptidase family protein n=1 Tax=Sciscionella marina TaxID=508770 RepID=UPI0012F62BA0|nr:peptidase M15 [Sciscionella marina]